MELDFSLEVNESEVAPIIRVKGEIDVYTCPKLNKTLRNYIEEKGKKNLILNLENIQYIDSTGLGIIAHSARSLDQQDGKIQIVCTKPQVIKIFEVSGLDKKNITIFKEEKLALASLN